MGKHLLWKLAFNDFSFCLSNTDRLCRAIHLLQALLCAVAFKRDLKKKREMSVDSQCAVGQHI